MVKQHAANGINYTVCILIFTT